MKFIDTIKAKSDQLNAVDIAGSTKTITITNVKVMPGDQPVIINYQGDEGKPYKPCKSMRRAILQAWGEDEKQFIGKSLTLFCDPSVIWAGEEVGGLRICAMSDIPENGLEVIIQASRSKRKKVLIEHLKTKPDTFPADKFVKALPWVKQKKGEGKTLESVIVFLEKTGTLTDAQMNQIHAIFTGE